jgi:hypothetical protein
MIRLLLYGYRPARPPVALYRLAQHETSVDEALAILAPWRTPSLGMTAPSTPAEVLPPLPTHDAPLRFEAPAWIAGAQRLLRCRQDGGGWWLDIGDLGGYWVAADGSAVARLEDAGPPSPEVVQALLSPGLALALAAHDTFMLHAGAIAGPDGLVAFLGDSGAGKSTLAGRLGATPPWRLAADDGLCVTLDEAGLPVGLPDFPQPRLPWDAQPGRPGDGVPSGPFAALVVLAPAPPAADLVARQLAPRHAAAALIRHTMAGRLFGPALNGAHLGFASDVAEQVPAWELTYPHRAEAIDEVRAWLTEWPRSDGGGGLR